MEYGKDGAFEDPVVRCVSCQTLIKRDALQKVGRCLKCGNRRVQNVFSFTPGEKAKMIEWGIDKKFLELFEGVEDA